MAALWNRAGHYIFAGGFSFYSSYPLFLAKSQPLQIGCTPYFHTWCGRSANLRCRSETCCTRLAENTGRKTHQKIATWDHRTTLSGYIFAIEARIDNRKQEGQHPLTGERATNFRRDLEAT